MKKIISYIIIGLGIALLISLYPCAILLKDSWALDIMIFIIGYAGLLIFFGGYLLFMALSKTNLNKKDPKVYEAIKLEQKRQIEHIELIASENYVSQNVQMVVGSILTNKYAEGYPKKRYYGGCENVDTIEQLAIDRVCKLFGAKYANVQPHSGSQANMAVYRALLKHGDTVLSLSLNDGGHLTHGHSLSFSGQDYKIVHYSVNLEDGLIDYAGFEELVKETRPQMIIAGASAYPRAIDFKFFGEIAKKYGAYLMVDMAHIAGLVAAGLHQNPVEYADVVTSTTHKTLRGPRGGIILTNDDLIIKKINQAIFPGIQGGPLMHIIAGKAVAFGEALEPNFKEYQRQVVKNCQTLGEELIKKGYKVISGGTDNHMILVDVKSTVGITGKQAEDILHKVNITCNKNTIPGDTEKPAYTSGIRLGTPAITTRGMKEKDMVKIAEFIHRALTANNDEELNLIQKEVVKFTKKFKVKF